MVNARTVVDEEMKPVPPVCKTGWAIVPVTVHCLIRILNIAKVNLNADINCKFSDLQGLEDVSGKCASSTGGCRNKDRNC